MKLKILFVLALILITNHIFATEKKIYSLNQIEEYKISDAEKLYDLAWGLKDVYPDSAMYFANLQHLISKKIDYPLGLIRAQYMKGFIYFIENDFDKAAKEIYKGLEMINNDPYENFEIQNIILLQLLSRSYEKTYNYKMAIEYNMEALQLSLNIRDTVSLGDLNYNMGVLYQLTENLECAKNYYLKSIDFFKFLKDQKSLSRVYNAIGVINMKNQLYTSAIENYKKAIQISDQIPNQQNEKIWFISNIGEAYFEQGIIDSSLYYYNKALKLSHKLNDIEKTKWLYNNLGDVYLSQKKYISAINYYEKSLEMASKEDLDKEYAHSCEHISIAYQGLNDYKKAAYFKDHFIAQTKLLKETNEKLQEQNAQYRMKEVEWMLEKQMKEQQLQNMEKVNFWFKVSMSLLVLILAAAAYKAYRYYSGVKAVKKWLASDY